jgi:quercetin dioxygenase-like cupin family protein
MMRCVRLWTGADGASHFEEGLLDLAPGRNGDSVSAKLGAHHVSFEETPPRGGLDWHTAPVRQLVVTLSGVLEFRTRNGSRFELRPGDVLLAEDTAGSGHAWRLIDDQPWRRLYIVLEPGAKTPFRRVDPTTSPGP